MTLSEAEQQQLLAIARQAIESAFSGGGYTGATDGEPDGNLAAICGNFVTLTRDGNLRGCIGNLSPQHPLIRSVAANARKAAFEDHRFPRLDEAELPLVRIEVSVLTPPQPLAVSNLAELMRQLTPGVHGLVVEEGSRRATFLPQVWDKLPDAQQFLAHLFTKAGLSPGHWSENMRFSTMKR